MKRLCSALLRRIEGLLGRSAFPDVRGGVRLGRSGAPPGHERVEEGDEVLELVKMGRGQLGQPLLDLGG